MQSGMRTGQVTPERFLPMINFMFWNLGKKDLKDRLARLAILNEIDVLILAECGTTSVEMLEALNATGQSEYFFTRSECSHISIYARFIDDLIVPVRETHRLTVRHLTLPGKADVILAAVHFPGKLYWDDRSQDTECVKLSEAVRMVEETIGHRRTVLVGDLNMNPFQAGVVSAAGLHGVMTRQIASRGSRTVLSDSYEFFYNPMWSLFGDHPRGPAGTYYYERSEHQMYFWNMFDQVMIRPQMLRFFDNHSLEIVVHDGLASLLMENGLPEVVNGSDHLPIKFSLGI